MSKNRKVKNSKTQEYMQLFDSYITSKQKQAKKTPLDCVLLFLNKILGYIYVPYVSLFCIGFVICMAILTHWSLLSPVQDLFGKANMISFNYGVLATSIIQIIVASIEHYRDKSI